jgi:hypothetical protein
MPPKHPTTWWRTLLFALVASLIYLNALSFLSEFANGSGIRFFSPVLREVKSNLGGSASRPLFFITTFLIELTGSLALLLVVDYFVIEVNKNAVIKLAAVIPSSALMSIGATNWGLPDVLVVFQPLVAAAISITMLYARQRSNSAA